MQVLKVLLTEDLQDVHGQQFTRTCTELLQIATSLQFCTPAAATYFSFQHTIHDSCKLLQRQCNVVTQRINVVQPCSALVFAGRRWALGVAGRRTLFLPHRSHAEARKNRRTQDIAGHRRTCHRHRSCSPGPCPGDMDMS